MFTEEPLRRPFGAGIRSPWAMAAAALVMVLLVPHASLLLGRSAPMWDAIDFFAPYYMLVGDFARNGKFLLWNPYTLGGLPDYLEPVLGAFSPLVILFGLVFGPTRLAFELYWLFVWALGGLGIIALARHLGAPAWGGFVSALGFVFSGFYTGNAEHTHLLYSVSFLPLLVWRVDVALSTRRLRPALEAAALYGFSGLGGYPGLVLLNGAFVFLWSLGRVIWCEEMRHTALGARLARVVAVHAIVALLGAAIMSPTYLPFFIEGSDVSDRAGPLPRDDAVEKNPLHPAGLFTFSSPVLSLANIFDYTDISMRSVYVGCLIPVLAVFALARRGVPFRWWLLLLAVLFLATALARTFPLRGWMYEWLPPMRYFRHPPLFRCYTIFALTVLALYGSRDLTAALRAGDWQRWRRFGLIALCMAAAAVTVYAGALAFIHRTTPPPYVSSHWHTLGSWLLLCVVAATGLVPRWHRWRAFVPLALVGLAIGDGLSTSVLARPTMYDVKTERWLSIDTLHRSELDLTPLGLTRGIEQGANLTFASKTPMIRGYSGLASRLIRRHAEDDALIGSVTGARRVWFSTAPGIVERSEDCFDLFRARAAMLEAPPMVIHARPQTSRGNTSSSPNERTGNDCAAVLASLPASKPVDSVEVAIYHPDRLTLQVDVPVSGWLLVTDTWSRSWRVTVNGRDSSLFPGNFAFRALEVPAGTSIVDFRYEPVGFPGLLILSWGLLAGIGGWSLAAVVPRQKDRDLVESRPSPSSGDPSAPESPPASAR